MVRFGMFRCCIALSVVVFNLLFAGVSGTGYVDGVGADNPLPYEHPEEGRILTKGGGPLLRLHSRCTQGSECMSGLCTGRPGKKKKCRFCAKKRELCRDSSECCSSQNYCDNNGQCMKCPKGVCPLVPPSLVPSPMYSFAPSKAALSVSTKFPSLLPSKVSSLAPTESASYVSSSVGAAACDGDLDREETLFEILQEISYINKEDLEDGASPQGMAFNWLVNEDPAQIDPCTYGTVKQRYALAVFFCSLNMYSFLSAIKEPHLHECAWHHTWHHIGCVNGVVSSIIKVGRHGGTMPLSIGELTGLTVLALPGNGISGTIPSSIGSLTALRRLFLEDNKISGTIPSTIGALTALRELDLYNNQINGTIPSTIGELSALLHYINLTRNKISGTIPSTIGELTALVRLYLYDNKISGTIPSSIGALTSLFFLSLSFNEIGGTIPSSIGALTELWGLFLDNNKISGTIPSSIGEMTGLRGLHLRNNEISGTIPSTIGALEKLKYLHLDNNEISGTIPPNIEESLWYYSI